MTLTGIKVHAAAVPASKDKSAAGFAYAYDRFDVSAIDFTDMRFQASNGSTSWTGRIGHGLLSDMVADKVADARFDDFTVTSDSGTVKIGHLGWHGPGDTAPTRSKRSRATRSTSMSASCRWGQTPANPSTSSSATSN